jgi:hypothetical protein
MADIAGALQSGRLTALENLWVTGVDIAEAGLLVLAESLRNGRVPRLRSLNLGGVVLTEVGL